MPASEESSSLIDKSNKSYGATSTQSNTDTLEQHSEANTDPNSGVPSTSLTAPNDEYQNMSTLNIISRIGYGLGHVHNDLCASVWFSYTLLFLQGVLKMAGPLAGALVMVGQVGDALATPVIGILVDKYGTKRGWHIIGTVLIFFSFPLIFSLCPWCLTSPTWWPPIYFATAILIFQTGWATVQVTHLAMIPEVSRTRKDRSDLTAMRYSATVCSSVIVFGVVWAELHGRQADAKNIGPADGFRFRDISLIITLIGVSMTVCFHFALAFSGYGERRQEALDNSRTRSLSKSSPNEETETSGLLADQPEKPPEVAVIQGRKNFLKSPLLYQNAFLYVFSRLFMTTALIYIPLWLNERSSTPIVPSAFDATNPWESWEANKFSRSHNVEHIATVPLVSFLASFVASMIINNSRCSCSHQVAYLIGSTIGMCGCIWVGYAAVATAETWHLYAIAVLFGAGSSITMISSLCITAAMIGRHADQSGFIYSLVTFADKMITGIVVIAIESLKCQAPNVCPEYYKDVLAYACGAVTILGVLTLATLKCNRRPQST